MEKYKIAPNGHSVPKEIVIAFEMEININNLYQHSVHLTCIIQQRSVKQHTIHWHLTNNNCKTFTTVKDTRH